MYTWEIDDLVRARGNILSVQEYIQVCRSPQVDHVKRDGDRVKIWTRDGGFWEIEIKKQDSEDVYQRPLFKWRNMMKYRKKPVVIEAIRYMIDDSLPDWFMDRVSDNSIITHSDGTCEIKTLEGIMKADKGDFIILGVNGEVYPCKPDIFEKTYELVD